MTIPSRRARFSGWTAHRRWMHLHQPDNLSARPTPPSPTVRGPDLQRVLPPYLHLARHCFARNRSTASPPRRRSRHRRSRSGWWQAGSASRPSPAVCAASSRRNLVSAPHRVSAGTAGRAGLVGAAYGRRAARGARMAEAPDGAPPDPLTKGAAAVSCSTWRDAAEAGQVAEAVATAGEHNHQVAQHLTAVVGAGAHPRLVRRARPAWSGESLAIWHSLLSGPANSWLGLARSSPIIASTLCLRINVPGGIIRVLRRAVRPPRCC
jgi:hypothetical protein